MSNAWYVIVIIGLAAAGVVLLLNRRSGVSGSGSESSASEHPLPDYRQDRENARHAHMTEEDRAWEVASQERNREARERNETPAELRA